MYLITVISAAFNTLNFGYFFTFVVNLLVSMGKNLLLALYRLVRDEGGHVGKGGVKRMGREGEENKRGGKGGGRVNLVHSTLIVGGEVVTASDTVRNLNVTLDAQLTMKNHVDGVARSCFY